ncbi:hypothetical protein Aspvir_009374 [Aspergillus viridinutans]|uniref:Alcohol dehydrogenase-like N-terminal domain-containing protein n=1 Tax=Aspergillus viridinutans TaxID=75553 RepID=A0A9P3BYC1_ASPVI|nr:uncharacterized protein Aspvir_009374 [Aspergillus viridinutans]GIK05270.1 hypothetical protein Aspvir_009374 [Aspergillus viridinutans]
MQVPQTHKAVVYDKPGIISTRIVELDTPSPGPGQILVKMWVKLLTGWHLVALTSQTQYPFWNMPLRPQPHDEYEPVKSGQVGGHEGVGVVAQLGPSCEHSGVNIGDRVGIKWIVSACGNCMVGWC